MAERVDPVTFANLRNYNEFDAISNARNGIYWIQRPRYELVNPNGLSDSWEGEEWGLIGRWFDVTNINARN